MDTYAREPEDSGPVRIRCFCYNEYIQKQRMIMEEDDIHIQTEDYEYAADGTEKGLERAEFWFQAAIDKGPAEAAENLAEIREKLGKLRTIREAGERR